MAASFSLIIEDDAGKQIVVPFAKDVITIGRKEGNTIRLTERNVSRFHARLSKEASHVVVEDLTSFNGVKLNGDRIAGRVEVGAGDVIEIGDYHLEFRAAHTSATTQKMGPAGAKSAAIDHSHADDDEFEGDTQRWDQPPSVGAMMTVEERVPTIGRGGFNTAGDTEKLDLDKLSAMVGAGQAAPPPAPVSPAQSWPPPPRAGSPMPTSSPDLEATTRQPVAPTSPAVPLPIVSAPSALTAPLQAAPADDDLDATQDMPLPAVVQARATLQAQGIGVRREPSAVEQTEQLRIPPSMTAVNDDLALPRLVVLNTIFSGSTFPLRAMENVLGRTDDNDIVLEHRSVSRNHAKLVREGERVRILDLKSANGVLVNNEEVEQHVLKSGDVIELGRVRIRFVPVGERFVVPPEEIERARIADANGDGDGGDDAPLAASNIGSPLRGDFELAAKKPIALYVVLVVLVLMVLGLGAIVLNKDENKEPANGVGTAVGAVDVVDEAVVVAAAPPPAVPPVKVRPSEPNEPAAGPKPVATSRREPKAERPVDKEPDREKPREAAPPPAVNEKQLEEARKALFSSASSDPPRGVKLLEDLVRRNPREPRFQLALATGYKQIGQPAKAKATYETFLQQWPTGSDAEKVRTILADPR